MRGWCESVLAKGKSMEILKVRGGKKLEGTIRAAGAKNAMTKLLVASLLSDKKCTFHNVPNIGDVEITLNLCKVGNHYARIENVLCSAALFRV
jgi:UDP-N-acetylglucosamine enolpyruvyl transferase